MGFFNHFTFSALLTSIATFLLGFFILLKGRWKRKLYVIAALYSFSIAWWSFCVSKFTPTFKDPTIVWGRLLHFGAILIPALFVHFVYEFLEEKGRKILIPIYLFTGIFLGFNFLTQLLIKGIARKNFYSYPTSSIIYPFFFAFFIICVVYGLYKLFRASLVATGNKKNQIKYLLWSSVFGYLGGLKNFLIIIGLEPFPIYPYGTYAIPIYVLIVTYAIVKYRLMAITVTITRTSVFIAVYTLVLGLPFVLTTLGKAWLIELLGANWWIGPLVLMAVLATAGPFVYIFLQSRAEAILLREQRRYQETLKQAAVGMTRIRDINQLLSLIVHIVTRAVRISHSVIYLYDEQSEQFLLAATRNLKQEQPDSIRKEDPLITWLHDHREPVVYEEVKQLAQISSNSIFRELEEQMGFLNASVLVPSFVEDRLLGLLILGDKRSGQIYTQEDLNIFSVLASQAALAIENAQFIQEAQAMQEQIAQAEKMATVGTMADGLSHQINNRLHALSMIAGDTLDTLKLTNTQNYTQEAKETLNQIAHALERIQANVMQGKEVVSGLLKYSRKGEEGLAPVSLDEIIDGALEMVKFKIKLSEIDLVRDYSKDIPKIRVNLTQLQEVFFNLIDNAYDAMKERKETLREQDYRGRITVTAQQSDDNYLKVIFADNGIGVKDEDKRKMFTPFFTSKVSSRRGTGLGLFVIQRIITQIHQGKIGFESEYGKGTRFILELSIVRV